MSKCPVRHVPEPAPLPVESEHPLEPPRRLAELNREFPVSRLLYPSGEVGWLVTRLADVRTMLGDARTFSSKNRARFFNPTRAVPKELANGISPPGMFISDDPPSHGVYRGRLSRHFTPRRMKDLEPRIEEIVTQHLDEMARGPRPADLVQAFASPVPSLVICELLGVPYADRTLFQNAAEALFSLDAEVQSVALAAKRLREGIRVLIRQKRETPDESLLASVIADDKLERPLTEDELVNMTMLLLVAGHESTVNTLALGTLVLLRDSEQLGKLRADMALVDNAVEELLRILPVTRIGLVRIATCDTVLGGQPIKAGEPVVASLIAANRDPERYDDGDRLDIMRGSIQHVAFGHGVHTCLGHPLARVQLRIALRRLLERFPNLELAAPLDQIRFRSDREIYGVYELPVTW